MQLWPSLIVVVHQEFDTRQVLPICLWISWPQEIKLKMCGNEKATEVSARARFRFKSLLMFIRTPLGRVPALQLLKSVGFRSILRKLSNSSSHNLGPSISINFPLSHFTRFLFAPPWTPSTVWAARTANPVHYTVHHDPPQNGEWNSRSPELQMVLHEWILGIAGWKIGSDSMEITYKPGNYWHYCMCLANLPI